MKEWRLMNKVVLGMSGGVDSSVAAYLLKKDGFDVLGITMELVAEKYLKDIRCNLINIEEARLVAEQLGVRHQTVNFKNDFDKQVIDYFVREYGMGLTPNPCITCNKKIKFGAFYDVAMKLGYDYVSTGHYANVEYDKDRKKYILKKAKDPVKDQTYFLYNIPQSVLARCKFPLGNFTKDEVRDIARDLGIITYSKKDSEEICFVENDDHGSFIEKRNPELIVPGNFIDEDGNVLGQHKGIIYYTIGQRKGLGIALGRKVYVSKIKKDSNEIVLSDAEKLYKHELAIKELNLISRDHLNVGDIVECKIRHGVKTYFGEILDINEQVVLGFEEPVRAPSKGQSLVMYDNDEVIGGGIICKIEGE